MISAIGSVSFGNSSRYEVLHNEERHNPSKSENHSSEPYVKVPVALLIALASMNVNAKNTLSSNDTQINTELTNPVESKELFEATEAPQSAALSQLVEPRHVHYQRRFRAEGKNYTMYFADVAKDVRNNVVSNIYFVPDDYARTKVMHGSNEMTMPPQLRYLIYHNTGNDSEFIGAYVKEFVAENGKFKIRYHELKLPDEIANDITHMLSGDTKFRPLKDVKLEVVNNSDLAPVKYEKVLGDDEL